MSTHSVQHREGIDALLAKNLVVARILRGLTQQQLADAAMVSRATIAQLETGSSDPRLSTIVELASALNLPTIFLLLGHPEVRAIAAMPKSISPANDDPGSAAMHALTGSGHRIQSAPTDEKAKTDEMTKPEEWTTAGENTPPGKHAPPARLQVPVAQLMQMNLYVRSGMLKDRLRAARVGAEVARNWGVPSSTAAISAGLFSAFLPGAGTIAGATLAELFDRQWP